MTAEARACSLVVDADAYSRAGRDPREPVLCAGRAAAPVCMLGRDLGREEVARGEPLAGPSGRLVRRAVLELAGRTFEPSDRELRAALEHVFLANIVPYKPPANRPFPAAVRERLRPWIERLLAFVWQGEVIVALGVDVLRWLAPYCEPGAVAGLAGRPDRHGCQLGCRLAAEWHGMRVERPVRVCPVPHPSPANARLWQRFPELLRAHRLDALLRAPD